MILARLGIYGWKEQDENLLLASLLTGDPLLLIGNHGSAKTLIANKVAEALGLYFEDEPGFELPEPLIITPVDVPA